MAEETLYEREAMRRWSRSRPTHAHVTTAAKTIERRLRAMIEAEYSDHGTFGE